MIKAKKEIKSIGWIVIQIYKVDAELEKMSLIKTIH